MRTMARLLKRAALAVGLSNALGFAGVASLATAVWKLASLWWAVLLVGVALVLMAWATYEPPAKKIPAPPRGDS